MIESCEVIPRTVFDDVEKALAILHDNDLVFGDLRPPNIICVLTESGEKRAKLVNFDWAWVHGWDRYPATMNAPSDEWAPGMGPNEVMMKKHDLAMFRKLPDSKG